MLTYEELLIDPLGTSRFLCNHFQLRDLDRISACVRNPSSFPGGCSPDNIEYIRSGDSWMLIQSWLRKLDATQLEQAQAILDRYEVEIYNMSSPLPDPARAGLSASSRISVPTITRTDHGQLPHPHPMRDR